MISKPQVTPHVAELVQDLRKVMSPNTASNLRERRFEQNSSRTSHSKFRSRFNRIKDYIDVAGMLGVSHIIGLSQTKSNVVLRLTRVPSGPTLHFRINAYSLARQVRALQKRPYEATQACTLLWKQYLTYQMCACVYARARWAGGFPCSTGHKCPPLPYLTH